MCPLWTRQNTIAFDQPLSFDTSSVKDMHGMFQVRFRLRLLPAIELGHTRTPRALLTRPSPLCHISRASLCRLPPLDSAE
jgi:hypothetical protein